MSRWVGTDVRIFFLAAHIELDDLSEASCKCEARKKRKDSLFFSLRTNDTNLQKQDRNPWLCPTKGLQLFLSVSFLSFSFLLGYLLFLLYLASIFEV